jgi:lipopolysaccharide/colanic/teichoic acid biosynthesis glycosyltransferase
VAHVSGFYDRVGKRATDLVVSGIVLVLTAPLYALCALGVRLTSGSPVYYRQERAGRHGEPFELVKFRTMKVGTHEVSGGYPSEDMVTGIGRVLRKTSLDELPQLWNIIRGEMSLVGPRPTLMEQVLRYSEEQRARLVIRPGVTGLAQIRYRNAASWSVRIQADLEYIEALSLKTDLAIILKTLPAVLLGTGVITGQTAADIDDLGDRKAEA